MKVVRLGCLVELVSYWQPAVSAPADEFEYLDISSLDRSSRAVTAPSRILGSEAPSRARQIVKTGDIIVSTVRPNLNAVAQIPPELDGATASTGFCVLRSQTSKLEPRYLFHWIAGPAFVSSMVRLATGASYPAVSDAIIQDSTIPLPPLEEQRRIAAILDQADALRAKRRAALAKLDSLTQSIFLDMFGDPVTNPKGWPQMKLTEGFNFTTGKLDSNAAVEGGAYPFFTCSREDYLINDFAFDQEALLLAGNNAQGDYSVKHYRGKFNAYQRTYVLTVNNPIGSYQYAKASLERMLIDLKRFSKGTNTKYLTMGLFETLSIQVPPRDALACFEDRIRKANAIRESQMQNGAKLDKLFSSLQQRAFAGDL